MAGKSKKFERSEDQSDQRMQQIQQELQEKYIQFQILRQHLAAMQEERVLIESKLNELQLTIESLKKLPEITKGEEIWTTLGSGTFIQSDIKNVSHVIVDVGAGIYLKKTAKEAENLMESRYKELAKVNQELLTEVEKINNELIKIESHIQKMTAKLEKHE